jgi:hypothetical protein
LLACCLFRCCTRWSIIAACAPARHARRPAASCSPMHCQLPSQIVFLPCVFTGRPQHKSDIRQDPEFRAQFHQMCANIGVDPLSSNKVSGGACVRARMALENGCVICCPARCEAWNGVGWCCVMRTSSKREAACTGVFYWGIELRVAFICIPPCVTYCVRHHTRASVVIQLTPRSETTVHTAIQHCATRLQGMWAKTLGFGDWYYELGVQVIKQR